MRLNPASNADNRLRNSDAYPPDRLAGGAGAIPTIAATSFGTVRRVSSLALHSRCAQGSRHAPLCAAIRRCRQQSCAGTLLEILGALGSGRARANRPRRSSSHVLRSILPIRPSRRACSQGGANRSAAIRDPYSRASRLSVGPLFDCLDRDTSGARDLTCRRRRGRCVRLLENGRSAHQPREDAGDPDLP